MGGKLTKKKSRYDGNKNCQSTRQEKKREMGLGADSKLLAGDSSSFSLAARAFKNAAGRGPSTHLLLLVSSSKILLNRVNSENKRAIAGNLWESSGKKGIS